MRPKILVADDEPGVVNLLRVALESADFQVICATSAEETLERFRQNPDIDLILLDRLMPGGDGVETLKKLRQISPKLPCCFVTGAADACSVANMLNEGAEFVFPKPFNLARLLATVAEMTRPSTIAATVHDVPIPT